MRKRRNEPNPEVSLKNEKHEKFCQLYAGKYWGEFEKACLEAGINSEEKDGTEKLIQKKEIFERIKYLRKVKLLEMEMDSVWIAQQRKEIVKHAEKESDRLSALKDLEKTLENISDSDKEIEDVIVVFNSKDRTS